MKNINEMQIAFFSNFLNHHQLPFCLEMEKRLGSNFSFVAFQKVPDDRLNLGYHDMNEMYDFVIRAYESEENLKKVDRLVEECDVIILGSAPEKYLVKRANLGKLSFLYSERIYKTGIKHMFSPSFIKELIAEYSPYKNKPVYLLCAGAYVARDYAFLGNFIGKTYKWGYFPEFIEYDINALLEKKPKDKIHILWAGRLIDWKHPEIAIEVARRLTRDGYDFAMEIIGEGDQRKNIEGLIRKYSLQGKVHMLGAKHPEEVREKMINSHIFLFTSDRNEGWGAVLNEAMNSGCAVVCNLAIGAVPFMVKNGYNGYCYIHNDVIRVTKCAEKLIVNSNIRKEISKRAYYSIANEWNPHISSERLVELSQALLSEEKTSYSKGPCSEC